MINELSFQVDVKLLEYLRRSFSLLLSITVHPPQPGQYRRERISTRMRVRCSGLKIDRMTSFSYLQLQYRYFFFMIVPVKAIGYYIISKGVFNSQLNSWNCYLVLNNNRL